MWRNEMQSVCFICNNDNKQIGHTIIISVQFRLLSSAVVKCRATQRIISIYMVCVHIHTNTLFFGKASLCEQFWLFYSNCVNNINIEVYCYIDIVIIISVKIYWKMNIRNIKTMGHSGLQVKLPKKTANNNISLVQLSETLVNAIRETNKKYQVFSSQHDKQGQGIV